jgi:hypothetical protein
LTKQLYDDSGLFADEAPELPPKLAPSVTATNEPIVNEKAAQSILERLAALPMVPGATRLEAKNNVAALAYPIASTFYLSVGSSKPVIVAFSTSRQAYSLLMQAKVPCFVGSEFRAVAYAAQNDRVWSKDFLRFVNKKAREPSWTLTERFATGEVYNLASLTWSIGQTLERIHAELLAIEVYR